MQTWQNRLQFYNLYIVVEIFQESSPAYQLFLVIKYILTYITLHVTILRF